MANVGNLLAASIIEKDKNGNTLWVWSYPSFSDIERKLIWQNSCITTEKSDAAIIPYVFFRHRASWYYITTCIPIESNEMKSIEEFSLCLVTNDFNPEKYAVLSRILCKKYETTANPADLLQQYLSVLTKGSCQSDSNGVFRTTDFAAQEAFATASLKDIVNTFGVESIYIYCALLLKKRVLVIHNRLELLLEFTRALPSLVWHRQDWSILHPWMTPDNPDTKDLQSKTNYVIGCLMNHATNFDETVYDIAVDVPNKKVKISKSCKDVFAMGKLHKDIARVMMQSGSDDNITNKQFIKILSNKTKELIGKLKSLTNENGSLTLEQIQEKGFNKNTENFLFNLALSEDMLEL